MQAPAGWGHASRDPFSGSLGETSMRAYQALGLPNSWFQLNWSSDVKPGQLYNAQVCGRTLVYFRRKTGEIAALDGFCPHLGASLADGHLTATEMVQCPFHGWRYGADGAL